MKVFLKILKYFLLIILGIVVIVFGIRFYNQKQTEKLAKLDPNYELERFYSEEDLKDVSKLNIPGVKVSDINGDSLKGYHLVPDEIKHSGVVLTYGGSEGSTNFNYAADIAQKGYEVFAMFYFNAEGLPEELKNVPLENFKKVSLEIEKTAKSPRPLTILGGSKGAEYALLLSTKYADKIDNIILYAPSAYVFQGLSFKDRTAHSSWTLGGSELEFLNFYNIDGKLGMKIFTDMLLGKPMHYYPTYKALIDDKNHSEGARIKVENSKANALVFAGGQDQMWPSAEMAETIEKNYGGQIEVKIFEKAGHIFYGPPVVQNLMIGGEYAANVEAKAESDRILFEKLAEWMPEAN